jgi:hypothetical protein
MPESFAGDVKTQGSATLKVSRPVTIAKETWNKDYKGQMSWTINKSQWLYMSWGKFGNKGDGDQGKVQGPYYINNEGGQAYPNNWAKGQAFGILANTEKFATALKMTASLVSAGMVAMSV